MLPRLAGLAINDASDRAAMGYPEHYLDTRIQAQRETFAELRARSREQLVAIAESPADSLVRRVVAGNLLALLGDPRIVPLDPALVQIPGRLARIGLPPERLDAVMASYADTGILRAWIEKETPAYSTEVAPFRIAKYPVTNLEYRAFLEATTFPELPSSWDLGRYPEERANHPVYSISADAADAYVAWLARRTGRRFRLPTEAEWELAAAGPDGHEFPWGEQFLADHANTVETGLLSTTPVGVFPRGNSCFGAADLAGNVEEYVADDYRPYPGGAVVRDDLLTGGGSYRVARGGSFTRFRDLARCRRRHGRFPRGIYIMGFRLAESGARP